MHLKGPIPLRSTIGTPSSSEDKSAKGWIAIANGILVFVKFEGSLGRVLTVALSKRGLPLPSSIFL